MIEYFGVWIVGFDAYPVAFFRDYRDAEEWGRENYFGSWLVKPAKLPPVPFATKKEIKESNKRAEELIKCFHKEPKNG